MTTGNKLTKIVEVIKPFTNGFGRTLHPTGAMAIIKVTNAEADRLIAEGAAVDLNMDGDCLIAARRKKAKELWKKDQQPS